MMIEPSDANASDFGESEGPSTIQRYRVQSSQDASSNTSVAREILLGRARIQDSAIAALRYAPTVSYILISTIYSSLMFVAHRSEVTSLWVVFCITLILAGVIWWYQFLNALKTRDEYEAAALKTPSNPFPVSETIWIDRLTEAKYAVEHRLLRAHYVFKVVELVSWIMLATAVYVFARTAIS